MVVTVNEISKTNKQGERRVQIMEDAELTRIAVQEIIREFGERKQPARPQECKINPLGKANKRFLGRTINSMISHNRREDERTHRNCQQKLRDLEHRHRKRLQRKHEPRKSINDRRRTESESSHEVFSSSASDSRSSRDERQHKKSKKVKKKKKKKKQNKRTKEYSNSESSTSESETAAYDDYEDEADFYCEMPEVTDDFYMDPQSVHNMAVAAATYSRVNQYLHYQALLCTAPPAEQPPEDDKELADFEENELKDLEPVPTTSTCVKPEEISLLESSSSSSSSSSLSSEADSGDELGDNSVMTIELSSDEDAPKLFKQQKSATTTTATNISKAQILNDDDDDDAKSNDGSYISLNSSVHVDDVDAVEILSSSASDNENDLDKLKNHIDISASQEKASVADVASIRIEAVDLTLD